MNTIVRFTIDRSFKRWAAFTGMALAVNLASAQSAAPGSAKQDFETLKVAALPLEFAPPGNGAKPTAEQFQQERKMQSAGFVSAAKLAHDYYTKYPDNPNASQARKIEVMSLLHAVNTGTVDVEPQALRLAAAFRADQKNSSRDRYDVAINVVQHDVVRKKFKSRADFVKEYHDRAMDLYGEFPNEPQLFDLLLGVARNADATLARSTATQLMHMPASAAVKGEAQAVIDRLDMPGKKVAFEWQDDSGKSYTMADMSGSTVVFFVWASWSPASADAAKVVQAALKPGVKLVSVNVDTDVTKAKAAAAPLKLDGPAYFDDRGLQGPLPMQLKALKVPSVFVVDPKGVFIGSGSAYDLAGLLATAAGI